MFSRGRGERMRNMGGKGERLNRKLKGWRRIAAGWNAEGNLQDGRV